MLIYVLDCKKYLNHRKIVQNKQSKTKKLMREAH